MKLEKYRVKEKLTYRQLAGKLRMDHTNVFKYCKGQRTPTIENALKIQKLTDNKVTINDWTK